MFDTRISTGAVAVILAGALTACGGGGGGQQGAQGGGAAPAGGAAAAPAAVANAGTISGVVNFAGTAPAMKTIDMSAEQTCADKHTTPQTEETVVANNGKLKNVFIHITAGLTGTFPPTGKTTIDQNGCIYVPHVLGVMAGENVDIKNSDGILHNIHTESTVNREFNRGQPTTMVTTTSFSSPETFAVKCDVHGWMHMWINVVSDPYFAVSGDDGSFSIGNVPPGDYTLEAWHEKYGKQTRQITVAPDGTVTVNFDYNASMATVEPKAKVDRPARPDGRARARGGGGPRLARAALTLTAPRPTETRHGSLLALSPRMSRRSAPTLTTCSIWSTGSWWSCSSASRRC